MLNMFYYSSFSLTVLQHVRTGFDSACRASSLPKNVYTVPLAIIIIINTYQVNSRYTRVYAIRRQTRDIHPILKHYTFILLQLYL